MTMDAKSDEMVVKERGRWPEDCVQRAFVEGMKWWQFQHNGSTAFRSEVDDAEKEAVRRYGSHTDARSKLKVEDGATNEKESAKYRVYFCKHPGAEMLHNSSWSSIEDAESISKKLQDKGYGTEITFIDPIAPSPTVVPEESIEEDGACELCGDSFQSHYSLGNRKVCYNKDPNKMAIITGNYFKPKAPTVEGEPTEIDPAVKLLADVMHLWIDGYIDKSQNSMAEASISSGTFDEIRLFLESKGISVDYSGWSANAAPKAVEPQVDAPVETFESVRKEWRAYKNEIHSRGIGGKDLDVWLTEKLVESRNQIPSPSSAVVKPVEEVELPATFGEWWNRQGRLYMAGSDVALQKAVMKVAELTWAAAKGAK